MTRSFGSMNASLIKKGSQVSSDSQAVWLDILIQIIRGTEPKEVMLRAEWGGFPDVGCWPAWRALSLSGRRVLDRIEIEHGHHGGNDNGKLPVTFDDFEDFGISHKSVAPAIREAVALGFTRITERGRPSESDFGRHPNKFGLTYLPVRHGNRWHEPADEWKEIKTLEEAEKIAKEARAAKDERAVAKANGKSKKTGSQESFAPGEKILVTGGKNHPETNENPGGKITLLSEGQKITLLSISRVRMRQHDRDQSHPPLLPDVGSHSW
jgi:hypothetical protein